MGYGGIENSVAIEFDCYQNIDHSNDPNGNHISVQSCGTNPNSSHHRFSYGYTMDKIPKLNDGNIHIAKIYYNNHTLYIYVDDLMMPILICTIDIPSKINSKLAFVGFTAATGGISQSHEILSWKFYTNQLHSNQNINQNINQNTDFYTKLNSQVYNYKQANVKQIFKKLKSLTKLSKEIDDIENYLLSSEKENLRDIKNYFKFLNQLLKILPEKNIFPVIDILRLLCLSKNIVKEFLQGKILIFFSY